MLLITPRVLFPSSLSHSIFSSSYLHFQNRGGQDNKGDGSIDEQLIKVGKFLVVFCTFHSSNFLSCNLCHLTHNVVPPLSCYLNRKLAGSFV
jgi:hypothetical protein